MNNVFSTIMVGFCCLVTGCINVESNFYEVALTGQIDVAAGMPAMGEVHLEFHHAQSVGEGELAHPLGEFDRKIIPSIGSTSQTLLYPQDDGAGLIVYGWLDADADGVLCAPGQARTEPAGLVVVTGYPAHALSFTLALDTACAGPELLFP
jgi:hypothetical protein